MRRASSRRASSLTFGKTIPMRFYLIPLAIIFASPSLAVGALDHYVLVRHLREEKSQQLTVLLPLALPLPGYPARLLPAGVEGHATCRFKVGSNGTVSDVTVTDTETQEPDFAEAATEAVKKWTFKITTPIPKAEELWMVCTIAFKIDDNYFPTGSEFAATRLSGREVVQLAASQAKIDNVDVEKFAAYKSPTIAIGDAGHQVMWAVTWGDAVNF